ncbi:interferon-induced guanylate-binding protein 1 [Platysternon megacephalum]|uniref:Interferon-induced guanylate-binding protein 1 n=1 Tax=Platysternon megacephalum TaxID=55544 RepID=A0A4D9DKL3_9SAUR|nr:interferon-induced guanylate-binding protein 1 [Platysternon megacephalum]
MRTRSGRRVPRLLRDPGRGVPESLRSAWSGPVPAEPFAPEPDPLPGRTQAPFTTTQAFPGPGSMSDMELDGGRATLEEEEDGTKSDLETAEPPSCPETAGTRAKDHCDSLLDSIDAQLSQLLWQGPGAGVAGGRTNGDTSLECSPKASWAAEMEGCCANQDGTSWGEAGHSRKEEYGWRLMHLLGSEQAPENLGDQSDSNSVCTEDFAARFREGMVDPLVNSDGEGDVPAGGFPAGDSAEEGRVTGIKARPAGLCPTMEACGAAAEGFVLNTARRQHILQRFEEGLEGDSALALSSSVEGPRSLSSRTRRESLESLGGRISRLSQSNTMDTPSSTDTGKASATGSRAPGLAPPERVETSEESVPWPLEGSSRWGQDSRENSLPFSSPLLVEELGPSQPLRALGASAGMRAWARESQPVRTAPSPSERRQTEYGHVWSDSPSHSLPTAAHGSPSLASKGEKSPRLIASPCPDQGLPPETLGDQGSALQGFGATTQLASSPESTQTPAAVISDGCVVMQGGFGPGDPEREAPELLQQGSVIPRGPSGRGITRAAASGGGEGIWRSWELQAGPTERGARGLTLCADPEAGISEGREMQSSLSPARDEVYPGPCKYKHVAGVPITSFDTVTIDSDLDSVRTETVQVHLRKAIGRRRAPGRSTKGPRCPRRDSWGCLGSSSAVTDEEEGEEEEFLWSRGSADWRSSSPARWSSMASRAESSWEGTRKEACMEHQDLGAEEERLLQRKSQLHKADLSLSDILGQKKDLESLRGAQERSQKEAEMLESCLKETRSKADEARADLLLQYRWDSCLQELPELEKELSVLRWQRSTMHSTQLGAFQAEVSSLAAEREELKARVHHLEGSLSFLERQELERQLSCCKAELFSEQRAARARIEELQECLEEAQNKLEERTAEGTELQEETTRLRLQLRELERKQAAALSGQIRDLRVRETEQELRRSALEKIMSEKELELVRLREVVCALTAEKEAQQRAMENRREEHDRQLGKMQQEKELEWAQQREELQCLKQQELQEFAESLEQVKARALQDQAASFQKEVENLTRVIEARDEEIRRQREAMQHQKESTQQLVRELKQEAKETVQSALLQEQRKWEAEKREALQVQRGTLEEQNQRAHVEALDKERRTVSVLQNKSLEYQKRIQELELHDRSLQREKQEALEELRMLLQEEKTEALRRLREELEQERARESDRLRARLQQLEEEQGHLRAEQNEMSFREREAQSQAERAERSLAREIGLACQRLQDLLPERGRGLMAHGSPSPLSASHALQLLHAVTEETQHYLGALQQELEAQKRTVLHFQEEKAWELRQQREQLHLESKEALEALKERLIQEHLQEVASLQRSQLKEAGGGEQQTLRQQLREKDNELRAIQRSMAHWKDQTTHKLARKFEEELNVQLETRFSWDRPRGLRRSVERLDADIGRLATDRSEHTQLCPTSSSSTPLGQHGFVSSKLLRQLQGRVRELRAENALYRGGSLEDLTALRAEPGQMGRDKFHGARK